MAIDKLTPRYLNKDNDERLIKPVEMTDALNVRISTEDDGDAMVLKNAYGNTEITLNTALPAGTNKVIGSVAVEQSGSIYYFVWNSNDDHCIYKYSTGNDSASQVYKDSVLEFSRNGFVKGNVIVTEDGDELLYFNDSLSDPKKINASKALRNDYPPKFYNGTDEEKLLFLTVAKQPPLKAPTYNIVNNPDVKDNRIKEKVFQFAYKYVYADGEHSALSPYSSAAVSVAQLRDGFNTESAKDFYNQIDVYVRHSVADVDKIVVYARNGNSGVFYEIDEIDNNGTSNVHTVNFTNSVIGAALSETETQKLYDNVPQLADSQEIVGGRLMYGGYTEGYPNLDVDVDLLANYKAIENIYNLTLTPYSGASSPTGFTINDSDLPSSFVSDSIIYVDFVLSGDEVYVGGNTATSNLDFDNFSIAFSDLDGTGLETYTITKTEEYITFLSEGLYISEIIPVPAGTSKADAVKLFRDRLTSKKYDLLLSPTQGQYVDLNNTGTNWAEETARFQGRATIKPVELSATNIELDIQFLELRVVEFFKNNKKKNVEFADIIEIDYADYNLSYQFQQSFIAGSCFISRENDFSQKSFKSGSSHKLGIVYYDDRNRSSGVQEVGDVYIESLNNRSNEDDLYGPSSIVMRLSSSPPSWARKWAPVYVGSGSNQLKLMYGIDGAFIPFRTEDSAQNVSPNNLIYLSLNSLFSEKKGYNNSTGADLQYSYSKGDVLRVIVYDDDQRITEEFNIVGFTDLADDTSNPILDKSSDISLNYTTGAFLIIEENTAATGFTRTSILNKDTNWMKKCVVEIYSQDTTDKNIYYELGINYDIENGEHQSDRSGSTIDITVANNTYYNSQLLSSTTRMFKGDVLLISGISVTVGNVWKDGSNYYAYFTSTASVTNDTYTGVTITNPDPAIDLLLGDIYFRRRLIYTSPRNLKNTSGSARYRPLTSIVEYIEDYSVSDFFDSKSSSIGRPISYIPNAETLKRKGSITYSDTYIIDAYKNGLSSFNLSLANFKDFAYEHGSIKSLVGYNQKLYFIQEDRCGVVAVNRNVITTAQGENLVALSTNILQSEQYYAGNYGTQNPESVAHKDGSVFFADANAGKVIRISSNGLNVISDVNMDSYFTDKFNVISNNQPKLMPSGVDSESDEYIISSDEITEARVIVNSGEYEYKATLDSTGTQVLAQTSYNPSAVFSFSTDVRDFDDMCDNFDDSLGAVVYLDELANGAPIYVSQPYQTSNLYGIATNKTYDFFIAINVNMFLPGFTFDNGYCNTDDEGSISTGSVVLNSFATAYSIKNRVWTTEYSYVPEDIVSVHNTMYSFKNGKIYKHVETASRNTFYGGATAESIVEVVSRKSPSAVKTFESISLEGNAAWDAVVSTTNQSATIDDTSFKKKEGMYYAYIHGATTSRNGITDIVSTTSTNEFFGLGVVDSVSNDTITFKNDIASMSFPLGATSYLYKINGAQLDALSLTASSISGAKDLTCNTTVTNVAQNDVIVLVADSAIEGDQIRDYYAKIKLTKTDTNPIELFAVNAVVTDSKAHN
jgi:hypothetical protein